MNKDFQLHTELYNIPALNFMPEVVGELSIPDKIQIHEVSLRECDQTPGTVLRGEEKVEMAREFNKLGVNSLEILAMVSQEDYEALKEISSWKDRNFETTTFARNVKSDMDLAVEVGVDRLMIESPISPTLAKFYGLNNEDEIIKNMVDGIKYARSLGLKVAAEPWDIGRASLPFIERLVKSVAEAGADQIVWGDSFNNLMPYSVYYLQKKMIEWTENKVEMAPHFHNDFGMATASTMAAISAGATIAHCAINSIGEKSGNAALEEIVVVAELLMGIKTDIRKELIYPIAKKFEQISKTPINNNKPIIGKRSFQFGSGFVVDAYNKAETAFEKASTVPFNPMLVGAPELEIIWGKACGASMVRSLANQLGYNITKEQAASIRDLIKHESLIRKAILSEYEVGLMIKGAASENSK